MKALHLKLADIDPALKRIFEKVVKGYGNRNDVFFVDMGFDYDKQGEIQPQLCVRIHLYDKKQPRLKPPAHRVRIHYYPNSKEKYPPMNKDHFRGLGFLQPGLSIGGLREGTGTLGAICCHKDDPRQLRLLSCHHVAGNPNNLVFQPGIGDGSHYYNPIGKVDCAYPEFDVALVKPYPGKMANCSNRLYGVDVEFTEVAVPQLGMVLLKSGRTTAITKARIDGIGGVYLPKRRSVKRIERCFRLVSLNHSNENQIPISARGDSGAVWMDEKSSKGIGLNLDGSNSFPAAATFAIALELNHLFKVCQLTLLSKPTLPS